MNRIGVHHARADADRPAESSARDDEAHSRARRMTATVSRQRGGWHMVIAAEWGTGQVFWSFLWFFLFFIWIWLLITVFADIFRSDDLVGLGQGAVVDLHHRRALPRRVRVPHRPRPQDGRARDRPGRKPSRMRSANRSSRRRPRRPRSWRSWTTCGPVASSTTPSSPASRPRRCPDPSPRSAVERRAPPPVPWGGVPAQPAGRVGSEPEMAIRRYLRRRSAATRGARFPPRRAASRSRRSSGGTHGCGARRTRRRTSRAAAPVDRSVRSAPRRRTGAGA